MSPEPSPHGGPLVVGYDGRKESERALEHAFREAALRGVEVVIVVVAAIRYESIDPYEPGTLGVGLIPPIPPEGPIEIQSVIGNARRRLEAAGVAGTVEWCLGDAVSEILRVARERKASAIVVGTHPHSFLGRLFHTDIAAELLREAECDVLVAQ